MKLSRRWDLWFGLAGTFIVNFVLYVTVPSAALFLWLAQWIYVVPAALIFHRRKRVRIAQGICIAAGISVLLDFAFCGYAVSHFG